MFCSSCGQALSPELSYCNRCGSELKPTGLITQTNKPMGLAYVLSFSFLLTVGLTLGGIALIIVLATELLRQGFPPENATALAIFGLLLILISVRILGRQLSSLVGAYLEKEVTTSKKKEKPIAKPPAAHLRAAEDYVPSVTEQTTRSFEPSFRDQHR